MMEALAMFERFHTPEGRVECTEAEFIQLCRKEMMGVQRCANAWHHRPAWQAAFGAQPTSKQREALNIVNHGIRLRFKDPYSEGQQARTGF
jgi:hypothetical protein